MQTKNINHCYECTHCFENHRSKTGYSCEMWGHDDFADDTPLDGYCHKFKHTHGLETLEGLRIFEDKKYADDVLSGVMKFANWYGVTLVSDYKELLGVKASDDDRKSGWIIDALNRYAKVVETPCGYFIELPRAFPID